MTDCIEWFYKRTPQGYGYFYENRKHKLAHRDAYEKHHNIKLKRSELVCHRCDNPACIKIEHLFLGSAKDNMADCIAKDRRAKRYVYHHRTKTIPPHVVDAIRNDTRKLKDIAAQYDVSMCYISNIRRGIRKRII